MENIKIFEEIANSKGYEIALLTTFNFDISFFERCLLNRLYENGIRKVSLFNDSKELNKALTEVKYSSIGKKYMVNPVEMKGAFHPKIILLLGMNKAKLFISSANITTNGYFTNNEIFNYIEYSEQNPKALKVIKDAITFFEELNELSYKQDDKLFDEIKELIYYKKIIKNDDRKLVHNLKENILEQISNDIKHVNQIDIAVPYYDNELNALKEIKKVYPEAKINLYLQNRKCKFNKEKNQNKYKVNVFSGFNEIGTNNFYHGKVFRFITNQESYILYGSANCTESALTKTIKDNGNIECDILEKGEIDEFDYFFNNFKLEESNEIQSDLISYKRENKENFFYKYGKIDVNLKLYLGCNEKKENIKITYNDENLKYKYIDNKNIEVYIKLEDAFEINDIFNIKIYCDGSIQKITCWYINEETLEINRNTENKDTLNKFEIDSKDDKYIEDRITLIRSMNITYEEYIKELENKNIVLNDSKEVTEEDLNDEGIISYIIPSVEDLELYHKNQMVNKIKNTYLQRYLNRYVKNNLISQSKTEVDENEKNIGNNRLRKPTTNEKRFKRFVNSRVNEMIKTSSFENIEIEKYLSSILVFYEIFDKYTLRDKVDGLFDNKYVIEIKKKMFFNLLSFKLDKIGEEIKNAIIILGIETIIKNKYINDGTIENYKLDAQNKEILLKINEKFDIRENVDNYTKLVIKGLAEEMKTNLNYSVEEKYINDQFGFKTNEQILNLIRKKYGSDTKINYINNVLEIIAETKKINDYQHLNQNLIYEIIMHYKNYNKILNKIIVKIENLKDDYSPNIDPIKYIFFEIYINTKNYIKNTERKSGKMDKTEYGRLQFI